MQLLHTRCSNGVFEWEIFTSSLQKWQARDKTTFNVERERAHNHCVQTRGLNLSSSGSLEIPDQKEPKRVVFSNLWPEHPIRITHYASRRLDPEFYPNMRRPEKSDPIESSSTNGNELHTYYELWQCCERDSYDCASKARPSKKLLHIFACRFTLTCGFRLDLCLITICCKSLFCAFFAFQYHWIRAAQCSHPLACGSVRFGSIWNNPRRL